MRGISREVSQAAHGNFILVIPRASGPEESAVFVTGWAGCLSAFPGTESACDSNCSLDAECCLLDAGYYHSMLALSAPDVRFATLGKDAFSLRPLDVQLGNAANRG